MRFGCLQRWQQPPHYLPALLNLSNKAACEALCPTATQAVSNNPNKRRTHVLINSWHELLSSWEGSTGGTLRAPQPLSNCLWGAWLLPRLNHSNHDGPGVEQNNMSHINFSTSYIPSNNASRHTKNLFRVQNRPIFQTAQTVAISVSHLLCLIQITPNNL